MRITVIGCGRWGSLIAWYLDRTGHAVTLYGRPGSRHMQRFLATRRNDLLELPESIRLSTDLSCVRQAEIVVISIGSQGLQGLMDQLRPLALGDKIFVLCMKGLEQGTGRRLSQIAQENLDPSNAVAVWLGPGHVQEFYRGIPNCMVIDSSREDVKRLLVRSFSSDLIRFYYGEDLIGNEVGAAAKNVVGIAADCGYSSPRAIIRKVLKDRHLPVALYPLVRLGAILFAHFDPDSVGADTALERCRIPVLLVHGDDDRFVPCDMSREMYRRCGSKDKELLIVPTAGHGASYLVDYDRYRKTVSDFVRRTLHPEG